MTLEPLYGLTEAQMKEVAKAVQHEQRKKEILTEWEKRRDKILRENFERYYDKEKKEAVADYIFGLRYLKEIMWQYENYLSNPWNNKVLSLDAAFQGKFFNTQKFIKELDEELNAGLTKTMKIAIDGPAGAGKTTTAAKLARHLNAEYIDTGAMYRAVTLFNMKNPDLSPAEAAKKVNITFTKRKVYLGMEDVTDLIRESKVTQSVNKIAADPEVIKILTKRQKEMALKDNVVMEGRDIGTVVLPDAQIKIFLTADLDTRAERRYRQLKNVKPETTFEQVKADMEKRDREVIEHPIAPLKYTKDYIYFDNRDFTLDETVDILEEIIRKRLRLK